MLYQLGPVTVDTRPFNANAVDCSTEASLPDKSLIGGLPGNEHTGYKADLTLSGTILPFHKGGLDEFNLLDAMCRSGQRAMVLRGDGEVLGWHAISKVDGKSKELAANGVGYVIDHSLSLTEVQAPGADGMGDLVSQLLSLFG